MSDAEARHDAGESSAGQPRRRTRWWMWPLILVGVLLLMFGVYRYAVHRRVAADLAAIRARGEPATAKELDAWYPAVPAGENAALVIERASADVAIPPDTETLEKLPWIGRAKWPKADEPLDATTMKLLRQVLADNAKVLPELRRGAAMKRARYSIDLSKGVEVFQPSLSDILHAVELLRVEAAVRAEDGHGDAAADSIGSILGIAESFKDEPVLMAQVVRLTLVGFDEQALKRVVNRTSLSDASLRRPIDAMGAIDIARSQRRALIGEQAMTRDVYDLPVDKLVDVLPISLASDDWNHAAFRAYRISGLLEMDHNEYLSAMREIINAQSLPAYQQNAAIAVVERDVRAAPWWRSKIARTMMGPTERFCTIGNRTTCELAVDRVALAVLRYRLAEHHLPERLADVAPRFIDALPADPFTGKPLHYVRKSGSGFVAYSTGEDKVDNGGAAKNAAGDMYEPGSDIVFEVHH